MIRLAEMFARGGLPEAGQLTGRADGMIAGPVPGAGTRLRAARMKGPVGNER